MSVWKFLDKKFELVVMAIFLAIFTVLMFTNVILRYLFGTSIVWGDELCRYCLVGSTFFSIPVWIRRRSGIRVDAVVSLLPKKVQKILDVLVYAVLIVFFTFLFIKGVSTYQNMAASGQASAAMHMPTKYLYLVVEIGFALAILRSVEVLAELLCGFNKENEEESI